MILPQRHIFTCLLLLTAVVVVWGVNSQQTAFAAGVQVSPLLVSGSDTVEGVAVHEPWTTVASQLAEVYGKAPLHFEVNEGQTHSSVRFLSRGKGYALFLTPAEAVLSLRSTGDPYRTAQPSPYHDAFVAKLNAAGSALVYSTYFGSRYNVPRKLDSAIRC
jgi:hypothetical protein